MDRASQQISLRGISTCANRRCDSLPKFSLNGRGMSHSDLNRGTAFLMDAVMRGLITGIDAAIALHAGAVTLNDSAILIDAFPRAIEKDRRVNCPHEESKHVFYGAFAGAGCP